MLFNSYGYIFAYLPATLLVYFLLGKQSTKLASIWLTAASLFFYAWWNPKYIILLVLSIIFNYVIGMQLSRSYESSLRSRMSRVLVVGVSVNLLLLGYYKYMNFFIANVSEVLGTNFNMEEIILPIGISFFTFTQIAFLVDASRGLAKEYDFVHYCLFVTYFPHLIAGPVLHHKEMMPQFSSSNTYRFEYDNMAIGISLFFFGLFKKTVLADNVSGYATPVFEAAARGEDVATFEAWGGALSYTLQLYFDFSGYTDMAIGSSRMFGVKLPINFYSPYKATNIIDFWKRWHISLSRFLRDYLYIPLGGNRRGEFRRYINLFITMLLGGIWHGANWTFMIWGGLHGFYLIINHFWQSCRKWLGFDSTKTSVIYRLTCHSITFIAVVSAWVFFRSSSLQTATIIIKGMMGFNGTLLPLSWLEDNEQNFVIRWLLSKGCKPALDETLFDGNTELLVIAILLLISLVLPNTSEIFSDNRSDFSVYWHWQANTRWLILTIVMGFLAILSISDLSEFIYFQF
jgi:alginate O-acetyltransferase complex protein AlgI